MITIWEILAIVRMTVLIAVHFTVIWQSIMITIGITFVRNAIDVTVVPGQLAFIWNTVVVAIVTHTTRPDITHVRDAVLVAVGKCLADVRNAIVITIG